MISNGFIVLCIFAAIHTTSSQCSNRQTVTFARWSGVTVDRGTPVFVYSASGEEGSLVGACLARCRELEDCDAVLVAYGKGNCQGIAAEVDTLLKFDSDAAYFKKICSEVPNTCRTRWWTVESTPGYHLNTETPPLQTIVNATVQECYGAVLAVDGDQTYRSAQWVAPQRDFDPERVQVSSKTYGNCLLNAEDKFTEPESYRVSNYYTYYLENQCRHDYPDKIDRCSYEEYYNQTLRHVEFTLKNYTKDECKTSCETEDRFVCRGFSWSGDTASRRGLCDLHSEDLVTAGSWLLRKTSRSTYYRRVICLNISVDCDGPNLIVTYRPRGTFRGRVYVPGRGEKCGAGGEGAGPVRLTLPLVGDCDVNYAYALSNTPAGMVNRTMAYVMVMIQNNPIIQTSGDRWVRVGCSPDARSATQVDATLTVREQGRPSLTTETGEIPSSAVYSPNSAPLTMYIVRADDVPPSAVSLGEPLELRIETTDESEIEAYHLVASSRLGDSSVLLLDSKGCPTGQVDFPAFTRTQLGGTQRLSARFKAFRFPTSQIVRFALMVRFCKRKCQPVDCGARQGRSVRGTNDTFYDWDSGVSAGVREDGFQDMSGASGVVAQGGVAGCGGGAGRVPLELEVAVRARDVLSAGTLLRAEPRAPDEEAHTGALVCVHELLLVALALAWLAVQVVLLLGCCVLVKRYRNLAELSMQKDYHSFDNVGFDAISTHRRVHWPDQNIDILHS